MRDRSTNTRSAWSLLAGAATRSAVLAVLLAVCAGCPGPMPPDAADASDAAVTGDVVLPDLGPLPDPPAPCAATNEAHIPQGDGTTACTRVGALEAPAAGVWPDSSGLPTPTVYVQPDATGRAGTMDEPVGTLAAALAITPTPAAIVLARGTHRLTARALITAPLEIVGSGSAAGEAGSTLVGPPGAGALIVSGAAARVAVRGVRIAPSAACTLARANGVGLEVTADASVTVRDVFLDEYTIGIRTAGATLDATDLTVRRACERGVNIVLGSRATLTSIVVRDGRGVGVLSNRSRTAIDRALVANNGDVGVGYTESMGGGEFDTIGRAEISRNTVTGLRVESYAGMATARVRARLLAVYGTRANAAGIGDGAQVGPNAELVLDEEIHTDAELAHGSEIRGNARAGVLATGDPGAGDVPVGRLTLTGGAVRDNRASGIFVQHGAVAPLIGYTEISGNAALGVAVTSRGSLVQFLCDVVRDTRPAPLVAGGVTLMVADGLSMSDGTRNDVIRDTHFDNNGRFGVVLSGSTATLRGCSGTGNLYGVGAYGATLDDDGSNPIGGFVAPPTMTPAVYSGAFIRP